MRTPDHRPSELTAIAARAAQDAGETPAELLDGYLEILLAVSATGRRLSSGEVESRRALGITAAEQGLSLRRLIELYLSATWLAWRDLLMPEAAGMRELRSVAEAVLRGAKDATVALADGYEGAQRLAIRQEEALRQEFIDDLLYGRSDLGRLAGLADRFGTRLAGAYYVAVVRIEQPPIAADAVTRRLERALVARFDPRDLLVTSKEGHLVCIAPDRLADVPDEITRYLEISHGSPMEWKVGVGRVHPGPGGIARSYEEARTTLELSDRLNLEQRRSNAADLLVYQVLLRDRTAIGELVATVLEPLSKARGGAQPLIETLSAYFATGGVTAATARRLNLSTRATAYRLERIAKLTGHSVNDPSQRFTLETAVLGAHLLGWPKGPLDAER